VFLFRPVIAGMWQHKDAINGVYSFKDLLDAHEMLDVKEQNDSAFQRWLEATR
jgi:hypothetical protein